ncbi:F-box/LRR-repeat protein At3g48880-like [Ananas comosus]|uniref:F-box/LRR-repeat protein At3g48880-like n=1 Tax=Ananas comosus TaxID=4615 RepID=A0A6P5EC00_ANACO|nr:F-box/LRR-repeat protein At3g48880-like [Ananas comosus]
MDESTHQNPKRIKDSSERRWEDLPVNCLVAIFSRLGLDDMTLSIPFVCKFWHEASLDPTCWKVLDFRVNNPSPGSSFGERFKHEYHVNNYTFRGFLKFVANRSHRLATKMILPVGRLPISDMAYICKECPMLKITWQPECDSNFIRKFILMLHETMLRSNR